MGEFSFVPDENATKTATQLEVKRNTHPRGSKVPIL